jgi:antitoxin FitA
VALGGGVTVLRGEQLFFDGVIEMAMITVRNIPESVHRALRAQAARRGHSMEAEVRDILASAVSPRERVKLGSMLADIGRRAKLTDEEFAVFEQFRSEAHTRTQSLE